MFSNLQICGVLCFFPLFLSGVHSKKNVQYVKEKRLSSLIKSHIIFCVEHDESIPNFIKALGIFQSTLS